MSPEENRTRQVPEEERAWDYDMPLPTEKSSIKTKLSEQIILLYANSKYGKSTLCSHFPNAFFLSTEPGLNSLSVYKDDVKSWEEILNDAKALADKKSHKFETIVIDTIDNFYKYCSEFTCRKLNITHESEAAWGKGFATTNNEFQRVLTKLTMLGMGLVMVSHAQEKEIDTRTGKIKKTVPTIPEGPRKIVTALADIILFGDIEIQKDETGKILGYKRVLRTKPNLMYDAGDRSKRLPESIDLDYEKLRAAFEDNIKV